MECLAFKPSRFLLLTVVGAVSLNAGACSSPHSQPTTSITEEPPITVPTSDNPVTAVAWVTPQSAKPGSNVDLHVRVWVAAGYHLYAAGVEPPFTPVSVKLIPCDDLLAIGPWKLSDADADGHLTNVIDFRQQLHITPGFAVGVQEVSCELTYQACNSELCWPPCTLRLRASFNLRE